MTTLWNISTKQELTEVIKVLKGAALRIADATPVSETMPDSVSDLQRAIFSDMLLCEVQILKLVVALNELVKLLPNHEVVRDTVRS